ncbi:putative bifunctional diguanylate cyclase/phosphodiesterase [Novosphingobium aquimarinum]|uniref:putative bifunctional diguanylate cyclase/phosphodiesterase n=1 Tax=Novosphingobium aquimarinum TaxID=2682494 RepID=UPI0012EB6DCB|nr:EAL domain-containing protein [Novosphingobium aquimarinum]
MDTKPTQAAGAPRESLEGDEADRDVIAICIVAAAIILFVGIGATVGPQVLDSLLGRGRAPDAALVDAFLLNIALIIFGWSRYRELSEEVSRRRQAEQQARLLAETDPMTGFLNRRSLDGSVERAIERAREDNQCVAMLMLDLDNFKQVNDTNGHQTGDELLRESARRIAEVAPPGAILARIGGDEFALAFPFSSDRLDLVERIASRLVDRIAQTTQCGPTLIDVTASVGIARSDLAKMGGKLKNDTQGLLEMADIAMYHAKRAGRNRYCWFEGSMADEIRFRFAMESGIRAGVPRGEFVPYYEQQIDLQTGELTGFEMLARWNSPEFGIVSPEIFIPIAEEIGTIADLSESVIAQALDDAREWDPSLTLAVNVSPVQLRDPWFAQKLLRLMTAKNFPPDRLEIEITESCLLENVAQVRALISSLKNQGITVSLDDFGTGYSSLAQLRSLPFDRIKIDRSFVSNVTESEDSAAIVHAIAMLGQGLRLPITAEGIENSEVLEHLRAYGPLKGQGFFYGRPCPAADISEMLRARGRVTGGDAAIEPRSAVAAEAKADEPALRHAAQ